MNHDMFLEHLTTLLRAITTPRLHKTERESQGELLIVLLRVIPEDFLLAQVIVEQECRQQLRVAL